MKMKKLIASTILAVSATAMLSGCVDPTEDNSVNISGDLSWTLASGDDLGFTIMPEGLVNTPSANATPINVKLSGSILDGGACQNGIDNANADGTHQNIPSTAFTTHNIGAIFLGFTGTCSGLSGTADITFSIGGKNYYGTITHTF